MNVWLYEIMWKWTAQFWGLQNKIFVTVDNLELYNDSE